MTRREFNLLLLAGALGGVAHADVAPGLNEATFKTLDGKVEKLVGAYNSGDWRGFYADFAQAMGALATQQNFDTLYTNMYKKQFGNIKSRKLNASRTSFADQLGLTVYDVTCDKKSGILAVNWMKENGQWKVQQVQLQ